MGVRGERLGGDGEGRHTWRRLVGAGGRSTPWRNLVAALGGAWWGRGVDTLGGDLGVRGALGMSGHGPSSPSAT